MSQLMHEEEQPNENATPRLNQDNVKYQKEELFRTFRERDSSIVRAYLVDKNNPNISFRCETLVHIAANNGDCPALNSLIWYGAKVDHRVTDKNFDQDCLYGVTPLYSLCTRLENDDRLRAMKILIEKGASVNVPCDNFLTPFLFLCKDIRTVAIREMISVAYDQLRSGEILPQNPFKITQIRHHFKDSKPLSRNEVGNKAAKTLIKMFIADENAIQKVQEKYQYYYSQFEQALIHRKEAMDAFQRTGREFLLETIGPEALDVALAQYLKASEQCDKQKVKMTEENDNATDLLFYHQTKKYKLRHHQLGELIRVMVNQIECNSEVQELIESCDSLQGIIPSTSISDYK
jgi:hypothetical protein